MKYREKIVHLPERIHRIQKKVYMAPFLSLKEALDYTLLCSFPLHPFVMMVVFKYLASTFIQQRQKQRTKNTKKYPNLIFKTKSNHKKCFCRAARQQQQQNRNEKKRKKTQKIRKEKFKKNKKYILVDF